ncbi:hypothetical protein KAFR_0K01090 [Kazachstania africana CBS 2517]|uniref:Probable 26S proteasome regulatory subunit p27 n=1 Tax=Kazachstania africana (strain ATCC 22294 / BCRC 22015 / CBS 2517 / CECT 1963 / NBRC 1671 / NRRL Y-8276) TaxID=1071382 RepID=H2B1G4_KAZAF|nr:hypothetical protein KAFR_0K01090 [Kazachstania africana CBS 2517]CCF60464.1 hypothetical protein KAFR_0K01090 [Kazachstania africana CBS 2517]
MTTPSELLSNVRLNPTITNRVSSLKSLSLNEVIILKDDIESELNNSINLLQSFNVDMHSSLVTPEGFPREDIDVLQVRMLRRNINMLRNDLTNVINYSHTLLSTHFNNDANNRSTIPLENGVDYRIPFAFFSEIVSNSPTEIAGIKDNDKLVSISNIHAANHDGLKNIQALIIKNENNSIPLRILRNDQEFLELNLVPDRSWGGRGLLGCKLQEL